MLSRTRYALRWELQLQEDGDLIMIISFVTSCPYAERSGHGGRTVSSRNVLGMNHISEPPDTWPARPAVSSSAERLLLEARRLGNLLDERNLW